MLAGAIGYAKKTHVVETDIALVAFPFTHVGGIIIGVFTPLLTGSGAVLMEAWTPQASTELIQKHAITLGNGAPAIHNALLAEAHANPDAYKSIRAFPSGGSTKPPQLHDDLMAAVPTCVGITSGYGMTEAPIVSQTDIDAPDSSKRDGEGTPTPGVEFKVLDSGELVVKGPQVMQGYVDASLDADAFTADGWLRTGDMASFDEHGAVLITGRIKDIIVRKGENISAKEVEDVLYTHPKIADVAVLGIPDEDRGEMAVAFVVPADPADAPDLRAIAEHCTAVGLDDAEDPGTARDHRRNAAQSERQGAQARTASPDRSSSASRLALGLSRCSRLRRRRARRTGLIRRVGRRGVLGVPLHRQDPRAVDLEAFDDAVAGGGCDAQSGADLVHRLMVVARRR